MDLVIRRAAPSDGPAIATLVERCYAHYVPRIGLRPAPMDADYVAVTAGLLVWLAEHDGRPVGVVVLAHEPDHVLIENLAVSPDVQGQGIGSRLLALAEETARAAGLPEVRLFTHELMTENIRYYALRGYIETERRRENSFSRVFFSKALT